LFPLTGGEGETQTLRDVRDQTPQSLNRPLPHGYIGACKLSLRPSQPLHALSSTSLAEFNSLSSFFIFRIIHQSVSWFPYDYLILTIFLSLSSVFSGDDLEDYILLAKSYEEAHRSVDEDHTIPPTTTASALSSLELGGNAASSTTSYAPDPHAVFKAEAQFYSTGLHSAPTLLYRTGKEQWSPPRGPEALRHLKELREVFTHPIAEVWNHDLGWKVVEVMDTHTVS
jgi:hypothetical protein